MDLRNIYGDHDGYSNTVYIRIQNTISIIFDQIGAPKAEIGERKSSFFKMFQIRSFFYPLKSCKIYNISYFLQKSRD